MSALPKTEPSSPPPRRAPLFRREAVEAVRDQTQGAALRIEPLTVRLLVWVAGLVAIALIAFAVLGEYTRKARVRGYLVPTQGLLKVHSQDTGVLSEIRVAEGQHVSQGDVLFVVSMERSSGSVADGQAAAMRSVQERRGSLSAEIGAQARIVALDIEALQRREAAIGASLQQLDTEIETQRQQIANAQTMLDRNKTLQVSGLVSQQVVTQTEQDVLERQGKLAALERTKIDLTRERTTLRGDMSAARLKGQTLQASLQRSVASAEQELTEYEMRRTVTVKAPANGTATTVLVERGQIATPAQSLVTILPDGTQLEAHLYVPSSSIGFLAAGQQVQLRYDAFPYERFGSQEGRITEISRALVLPAESIAPIPLSEAAYRVTVALSSQSVAAYASELPLRPGMLLDADVWLERRRIYQWLLDPLYAVIKKS